MKDINLLPEKYRERDIKVKFELSVFFALLSVSVISVLIPFISLTVMTLNAENDKRTSEENLAKYSVVKKVIQENEELSTKIIDRQDFLTNINAEVTETQFIGYLAGCIPAGANLKLASYTSDNTGVTIGFSISSLTALGNYSRNIRATGIFPQVKIQSIQVGEKGIVTATIQCSKNIPVVSAPAPATGTEGNAAGTGEAASGNQQSTTTAPAQ